MKKYTKTYVMKESKTSVKYMEVEDRDPSKIEDDGFMHCFSFYDVSYIEDDGKLYHTEKYNYSGRVYFGTRYSMKKFAELYSEVWPNLVEAYKKQKCDNICLIRNCDTCVSLGENDVTYDEVVKTNRKKR